MEWERDNRDIWMFRYLNRQRSWGDNCSQGKPPLSKWLYPHYSSTLSQLLIFR
jgi:hypothetical protein